jgi:hypothetical protein
MHGLAGCVLINLFGSCSVMGYCICSKFSNAAKGLIDHCGFGTGFICGRIFVTIGAGKKHS